MANDRSGLSLSDVYLTHDGYPLAAPPWATSANAWIAVLREMQAMRQRAGDFDPVQVPDVSTWFSRTCRGCGLGFLSRAATGRYCSNRCDPRLRARGRGEAPTPPLEVASPAPTVRRRTDADVASVRCEHCLAAASALRSPGRWFCSMRCARQSRARELDLSRLA